jgi:hypothetical protein
MSANAPTLQIINQATKDMLKTRLKRDELTKRIFDHRLNLYKTNILVENVHVKMADLKTKMYKDMIQVCALYKKNRANNIAIEEEHRRITEMKIKTVTDLIKLDNENLTRNFDFKREIKIGELTNTMNYDFPDNWEENRERLTAERVNIERQIKDAETKVSSYESEGAVLTNLVVKLNERKSLLEIEIADLTEKVLPLNDAIVDDVERHPVTMVSVAATDFQNPEDVLRNFPE